MAEPKHQQQARLRAIIVGAGITGLTAAHTFFRAGIDYVVVEKQNQAAPPLGATVGLFPSALRVLQQLGLLERLEHVTQPFTDGLSNRDSRGKIITSFDWWGRVRENHGRDLLVIERRVLLQVLYDALPEKSRVSFGKTVVRVTEHADGVEVGFADGTFEKGDFVVGADGVHSFVRQAMWSHANTVEPGIITEAEKKVIATTWTCLFGVGPGEPSLRNEMSVSSFGSKRSILVITQPKLSAFLVFWKTERPRSRCAYTCPGYTKQDTDRAAASVADLPINETMVFAELWRKKYRAQLADIQEGVLSRWHYGRFVLVGDAAHKVTPNLALGGNLGIESVTVLTNHLRQTMTDKGGPSRVTRAELGTVFSLYQAQQLSRAQNICHVSGQVSRAQAWDTLWLKFSSLYIVPRANPRAMPDYIGNIIRRAPVLDFVPLGAWMQGRLEWEHGGADGPRAGLAMEPKPGQPATSIRSRDDFQRFAFGAVAAALMVVWLLRATMGNKLA